jgi:hypothetical protein
MLHREQLCQHLHPLRSRNGLFHSAITFQDRAVLQSRGAKPKTKVLCLPVLRADETSEAGTGTIVEEFLYLGGFISSPASSVESVESTWYRLPYVAHERVMYESST